MHLSETQVIAKLGRLGKPRIELGKRVLRRLLFGDTLLPQEFTIALREPQTEIEVWLHGLGEPQDVTFRHASACSEPFRICVALDNSRGLSLADSTRLSLKFFERDGSKQLLGEVGLKPTSTIRCGGADLGLFSARSSANYCLPRRYLGTHYLLHAYSKWRGLGASENRMSFLENRAAMVTFIRPHPIAMGSVGDYREGNIFPMNITGELGPGRFGFALRKDRTPSRLVERHRRMAVSSVPVAEAPLAYQFASHHWKESIDWSKLPFATRQSSTFQIPVPEFAVRVRELEVEHIEKIGSHTFFVAAVKQDEVLSDEPGVSVVHSFYQAYRMKDRPPEEMRESVVQDAINKRGR